MIRITDVSIENYRSITGQPLEFQPGDYSVIVGPNNSGKSNILRALQLFFNGTVDGHPFSASLDFPKWKDLGNRAQTKITVGLEYDPSKDVKLEKAVIAMEEGSGQYRMLPNQIRLRMECSRSESCQWRVFTKAGLRNIKAELVGPVVDAVRSSVRFKYLPVGRDIYNTIKTELSEELIGTIFSGWSGAVKARQEINEAINEVISRLQPQLQNSGVEITQSIARVFGEIKKLELCLPFHNLETMLPSLVPSIRDSYETGLNQKGSGIQTSTLLFLLKYLADHHPKRHNSRVTYIWAIEEPESYLHPLRQKGIANMLREFSAEVQTIVTTHSPHFVQRERAATVLVVDKENSSPHSTKIIGSDFELARQALGVSLLDSMYLYPYNVVVEGPSDEIVLRGVWAKLFDEGRVSVDPADVRIIPGGNASGACTLFESLLNYGDTDETAICVLLDGDDAGRKALNGLLQRCRHDYKLKSNKDYFQLKKTMEWLASADVMEKAAANWPSKIQLVRNTKNEITDILVQDTAKKNLAKFVVDVSTLDDLSEFESLVKRIEEGVLMKGGGGIKKE
jgi:predicted ATP-dependent endonuclease of OLD family